MRFVAVLNREGGTLRTTDIEALSDTITKVLTQSGHTVQVRAVDGRHIVEELQRAARMRSIDVVLAGGGDGTISTAATAMMGKKKALAVLPAGTMNLFARSLTIPQSLDGAIAAFATGKVKAVDLASADGEPFVHQFSIGLHAKMVMLRDKMEFKSRLGKMRASVTAAYRTILNPPTLRVQLKIGETEIETRASGIGITNNLFGEGHLPYADKPDGGTLGIYVTVAKDRAELLGFAVNLARGRWRENSHVDIHEAEEVELKLLSSHKRFRSVIDGEVFPLKRITRFKIHKKALRVLVPSAEAGVKAA